MSVLPTNTGVGYALLGAHRHHGFTLVVVLTLTVGIGANTAVFTVVDNFSSARHLSSTSSAS